MSGRIQLDVPHRLGREAALARMQALGDYYQNRHHARIGWAGDTVSIDARYLGVRLTVTAQVLDDKIHAETADLGFLLRKRGTEYLRKKLERYVDPATPLEALPRR